jgi:hypothetical protein
MSGKFLQVFALIAISTTVASSTILMTQQPSYSQSATGCAASGNRPKGCPPTPVPEPITVVGTLIGGAAVWSLKKKLTHSSKQ